jgi:hypothetical protein
MHFTDLRSDVDHIAAAVRHGKADSEEDFNAVAAHAVLTFGQVAVGIFEELAAIREALEAANAAEHALNFRKAE